METEKFVLDCGCEGKAVEEVVELAEDTAELVDILSETDRAFFSETTDAIDGCVFMSASQ